MRTDLEGPARLAAALAAAGDLPNQLRPVMERVDRGCFIPERIWARQDDDGPYRPIDHQAEPQRWAEAVYSDTVVVTQFDDGRTTWPEVGRQPSCSASQPSAVAGMLLALDLRPGQHVLEIGTGTGYNAALLAELVGPHGSVTTLEVDRDAATAARDALRNSGHDRVDAQLADGTTELGGGVSFDRVIATAGVRLGRLPYWWVQHTNPGGVILAPMRADLASGPLVRFLVDDGTARGHALPDLQVGFMEIRSHRVPEAGLAELRWNDPRADITYTTLAPWVPLLADDHRWPIAVALPSCRYAVWKKNGERPGVAWLIDPLSSSWASIVAHDDTRFLVRQSGPRRLWNEAETAYLWWQKHGSPPLEAWEWTITVNRQTIHLP
ncbi:methyltransferase domain-containing protein [Amycolatopsis nigrescens]|uniref:methyltransferase domain-containing protein n=1 Tax=Amycolatopsis nigrescens TaxID=381445 RepID=UPI000375CE7F|nr:methyltransferase domain-containing protein [Amycolatopsis nigrescens]